MCEASRGAWSMLRRIHRIRGRMMVLFDGGKSSTDMELAQMETSSKADETSKKSRIAVAEHGVS